MNFKNIFTVFLAALVLSALFFTLNKSILKSKHPEEVVFDDRYSASDIEEVVILDTDFVGGSQFSSNLGAKIQDSQKILEDNSRLSVMIDGHGNKTETRQFINHPRLKQVLLRTSVTGQRQIFVYGQNGEVKQMSEDRLSLIFSGQADEIANAAEIYEGKKETRGYNFLNQKHVKQVQQKTIPNYEYLDQSQQPRTQPMEETIPENTEQTSSGEKGEVVSSQKPEDEQ